MSTGYLPNKETTKAKKLIEDYLAGKADNLWKIYGYSSRKNFQSAMLNKYGVKISEQPRQPIETISELSELEQQVLSAVQQSTVSVGEISRQVDRSAETIIKTIDSLREKSYEVIHDETSRQLSMPQEPGKDFTPTEFKYFKKFYRIGLVSDTHFCLPAQSKIMTDRGEKLICHIRIGDLVLTHQNQFRKVTQTFRRPLSKDEPLVQLVFRKGGHSNRLTLTSNHPALINRDNDERWCEAGNIEMGDFVLSIAGKCRYCNTPIPYWRKTCNDCDPYTKSKAKSKEERWLKANTRSQSKHYFEDILPEAQKLKEQGWRVIPVGRAYPDIIGIKDGKVVAFEVETTYRNSYNAKYKWELPETKDLFDGVVWLFKGQRRKEHNWNYRYTELNPNGFIGIEVVGIERHFRKRYVYNLEVEDDNSYIANRCVVHNCSKYQQVTLLYDAYAEFNKRQVDFVLHAGDLVDGKNMYRGQDREVFKTGADEQAQYTIDNYPKLERNRRTYIIGGQHDRSFYRDSGHNVVHAVCKERKDLVYRGFYKAEFIVKGLPIGLQHPGGGVAYALSYKMQKNIESMMGYVASIPSATRHILEAFGHWHVAVHIPSYMGVDVVGLPCFQSQTPYLEQLGKMPVVGFAIAEIKLDKNDNLSSTTIEFFVQNSQIKINDWG